jgi:hypothetical protein
MRVCVSRDIFHEAPARLIRIAVQFRTLGDVTSPAIHRRPLRGGGHLTSRRREQRWSSGVSAALELAEEAERQSLLRGQRVVRRASAPQMPSRLGGSALSADARIAFAFVTLASRCGPSSGSLIRATVHCHCDVGSAERIACILQTAPVVRIDCQTQVIAEMNDSFGQNRTFRTTA